MNKKQNAFWQKMEAMDLPADPLTEGEADRLRSRVLGAVKAAPAKRPRPRRLWWRAGAAAAACLVLLGTTNAVAPALAESLPVVGGVFAWLNRQDKAQLVGREIDEAAAPAAVPAATAAPQPDAAAEGPAVTLREIYCDGLYLRLALTLEDTDGSLAGYDQVTTEQRVLESPDELADASLLIDGEYAGAPFTAPLFQRVDETTFAAELIYPLREPIAGTHEASVTLFTLGVGGSWGENGYTQYDLPGGDRTLTFSFTADSSANRSWTGPVEQNGYTLEAIVATPGETCVMLRLPEGAEPPSVLVEAEGTPLEMARGQRMEDGVWRYDFDAAPAGAVEWTVTAADKNNGDATLARFAVEIAQETSQDF